jgi:hypothetical protein
MNIKNTSGTILNRLRFSGVEDYELDPGVCKEAAHEIERLRGWIKAEGERTDQCTYAILGEICDGCRCDRQLPQSLQSPNNKRSRITPAAHEIEQLRAALQCVMNNTETLHIETLRAAKENMRASWIAALTALETKGETCIHAAPATKP